MAILLELDVRQLKMLGSPNAQQCQVMKRKPYKGSKFRQTRQQAVETIFHLYYSAAFEILSARRSEKQRQKTKKDNKKRKRKATKKFVVFSTCGQSFEVDIRTLPHSYCNKTGANSKLKQNIKQSLELWPLRLLSTLPTVRSTFSSFLRWDEAKK